MSADDIQKVLQDAQARAIADHNSLPWYQQHLDISVPLFIIAVGLFQFVLRKWILPVSEDVISELEDQLPSQGLLYHPGLGVFLMIAGVTMLVLFNWSDFFKTSIFKYSLIL